MPFCWTKQQVNGALTLLPCNRRCRYHKRASSLALNKVAPEGLCLEAFHALYPVAFAMLTAPEQQLPNGTKALCPAGKVSFSLRREPFRQIRYLSEQILRRVASHVVDCEVLRWRIFVDTESAGDCPMQHQPRQSFEMNIGNTDDLCPAAANSFFPYLVPVLKESANSTPIIACPDHLTNVKAAVQPGADQGDAAFCGEWANVRVTLEQAGHDLPADAKVGDTLSVPELMHKVGLPCLSYANAIAPYAVVLREKGKLGYYTRDYGSAMVQCPNPARKVVTRIERNKTNQNLSFQVSSTCQTCPRGMTAADVYNLREPNGYFWLRVAAVLSPYLLNAKLARELPVVVAFGDNRPTVFRVHSDE